MRSRLIAAALLSAAAFPAAAAAQMVAPAAQTQAVAGTRLDVSATGEVRRVPDIARISTGVVTVAPTANDAIRQNAARMQAVRAALRRAGVADRDIQTGSISLYPEYRHQENQPAQLAGYRASNDVSVRFRDIANTGRILDALVAEGANQINGPNLGLDRPEEAMDEARQDAIRIARARADLYAQALGMRVVRILSVSETGQMATPYPALRSFDVQATSAQSTEIEPGEQTVSATLVVSFELQ